MSIRLVILGLLMECNRHPYEIRQTIQQRNWQHSFKLRDGSLYYAVNQLREEGMIEATETISYHGEHRPDKVVYRITVQGKEAFMDLLYRQLEQPVYPEHPMFVAMPFVRHGDLTILEEKFEKQLHQCEARIEQLQKLIQIKKDHIPQGSMRMINGMLKFSLTEREWLQDVLQDATTGQLIRGVERDL
ncbi:MAG: PadR family transcriptional regulator [Candidatus Cohnella colombiensis]|uniref:PadR family transcriptional regulator n=1 Tax=Candidatus Cohnella colombiensis TaxID=3121368 RepID=A0AA95EWS9_9BACL|nr:MAG: PadR family transcriptional regulator [Cohnella sp.]